MDRQILKEHLALAERHVREGAEHVARQRQIIAELERDGHDATEARRMLATFETTQAMHVADLERIAVQVAAAKK